MLKGLWNYLFSKRKKPLPEWPWTHREWIDVEIEGVGTVVGWDEIPGVVLCVDPDGHFVKYRLPDYKGTDGG